MAAVPTPPAGTQHQHRFAGLQLRAVHQRVVGRRIGHDEGRRIDEGKARRQRHAELRRCDGVGAEAAGAGQAGHRLADLQLRHAFAQGRHHAGEFGTGHEGQGGLVLVLVLHDQQVGKVEARRLHLDHHFARAGGGRRHFLPLQCFDADRVFAEPGLHVTSPWNAAHDRARAPPALPLARPYNPRKMKILLSNDDGYQAPGIVALYEAIRDLGEVDVVAPEHNNSAKSNALTLHAPLYVNVAGNGFRYVNGTPADCVHIALTGLLGYVPDLVVSGINNGANMGDDTIYSGTVGAAMEGLPVRGAGDRLLADRKGLGPPRRGGAQGARAGAVPHHPPTVRRQRTGC
jgi:hypothetical protein